ncbi:MAG: dihydropteroate synthase [bacterium]
MMSVLEADNQKGIEQLMREIKVDSYGIKIMLPKAITHLVRLSPISNIAANILKQEMLSLGADAAIARDALTGKTKKTACLIMGNMAQFNRLGEKLKKQPFGLSSVAVELSQTLANYQKDKFSLKLGRGKLSLGARSRIMAVVNLTPDSFSGDGLYPKFRKEYIIKHVENMVREGADIIDIGAESSRPGASKLSLREELSRAIPLIKILAKRIKTPISIDTYKPEVAKQALDNGAVMVNDITGLCDIKMARLVARYKAAVVIMHMKGKPANMQLNPQYQDVVLEIIDFLGKAIKKAVALGVKEDKIIIDPGIGFGKALKHNLEILKRLAEFKVLGRPILIGTSRKAFIGKILDLRPQERIFGTVSSCVLGAQNGAHILRVHDVREVRQALDIFDSINKR